MNLIDSQSKSGRINISERHKKNCESISSSTHRSHPSWQHSIQCICLVATCTHKSVIFPPDTKPQLVDVMLNYEMYDPATILKACTKTSYQITIFYFSHPSHIERDKNGLVYACNHINNVHM